MSVRNSFWCAAWMAMAISLQAHPGHEPFSEGIKHFVASPAHFGPALLFSLGLCAAAQLLQRRRERAFVRAIAAVIALGAIIA